MNLNPFWRNQRFDDNEDDILKRYMISQLDHLMVYVTQQKKNRSFSKTVDLMKISSQIKTIYEDLD